jgi:hypothetical protein
MNCRKTLVLSIMPPSSASGSTGEAPCHRQADGFVARRSVDPWDLQPRWFDRQIPQYGEPDEVILLNMSNTKHVHFVTCMKRCWPKLENAGWVVFVIRRFNGSDFEQPRMPIHMRHEMGAVAT